MQKHIAQIVMVLICLGLLTACGGKSAKDYSNPSGKIKNTSYTINGKKYVPLSVEAAKNYKEVGIASWYGSETYYKGKVTANGEKFTEGGLTAAHKLLPLPVYVKVTNLENGKSVIVRVNDRGPFKDNRLIDLSKAAAQKLGYVKQGTAKVMVEFVRYD